MPTKVLPRRWSVSSCPAPTRELQATSKFSVCVLLAQALRLLGEPAPRLGHLQQQVFLLSGFGLLGEPHARTRALITLGLAGQCHKRFPRTYARTLKHPFGSSGM